MLKKIGEPVSDFYTTKAMTRYYDKELLQLVLEVHNNALKMVEDALPENTEGLQSAQNESVDRYRQRVINNIQKLKI